MIPNLTFIFYLTLLFKLLCIFAQPSCIDFYWWSKVFFVSLLETA